MTPQVPQDEFMKYATRHMGMSTMHLEKYAQTIGGMAPPQITGFSPNVIEERQMNVAALDVFSRLMMDRIIFMGVAVTDYVANVVQAQLLFRNEFGNHYPNIQIAYLYNNVEKGNADFVSNYALDNLKHKLVGSVSEQLAKGLTLDLRFVFQDREGSYTQFENKMPVGEVAYDPFWVFDGKLKYSGNRFTLFASVNNIFDTQYNDIGNVIQPGRWLKTGVIYKIGFN